MPVKIRVEIEPDLIAEIDRLQAETQADRMQLMNQILRAGLRKWLNEESTSQSSDASPTTKER